MLPEILLSQPNQDFVILYFQWIDGKSGSWIVRRLARLRIKLPAMPGTDYFTSFDDALSQGASAVKAYVVHRSDMAIHVSYADGLTGASKLLGFSLGWQ